MKKVIYTLSILSILAMSCSSDDGAISETPTAETPISEIVDTQPPTMETPTMETSRVLPIRVDILEEDGTLDVITYTYDDKMRLIKEVLRGRFTTDFIYEDDKLVETVSVYSDDQTRDRETYSYNDQGMVNRINSYVVSYSDNNNTVTYALGTETPDVNTYSNGNMLTSESEGDFYSMFTYGQNKGPFANLSNRELLMRLDRGNIYGIEFVSNNLLTDTSREGFGNGQSRNVITNYSYTFTEDNLPRVVRVEEGELVCTYTYTYNND